ncbi:MAG: pantetheine-phosphate adenylyltransferase [Planctomycetes bacterium]|nr:pantetheine-phosphate adenylyltransferase [Planctomycetota bacterium]
MKKAIYPGTFDPVTNGHLDIMRRGAKIFDELIVAIGPNPAKTPIFDLDERVEMLKLVTKGIRNIRVDIFDGLIVDYVHRQGTDVILKGIRTVSDFEYEFQMALTNRVVGKGVETVFVMTSEEYAFLSSTMVKEIAKLGGDVSAFVNPKIGRRLKKRLKALNGPKAKKTKKTKRKR